MNTHHGGVQWLRLELLILCPLFRILTYNHQFDTAIDFFACLLMPCHVFWDFRKLEVFFVSMTIIFFVQTYQVF